MVAYRKAEPSHFENILVLQKENLITNPDQQRKQDGFLSIEFSKAQL
jgi:hypothetical protein